ncbi:DUF6578 domain-containing protein [Streptomyces sp. NPDC002092]
MGLRHVFYESWQMECCGTPFSVGEKVSWPLRFVDADEVLGGGWHEEFPEIMGAGGPGPQAGLLTVETHGGKWPEVAGRVRAIRVVTQEYAETAPGSRSWEPVRGPGTRRLRRVDECPKWFADEGPREKGRRFVEAGVVVTLDVAALGEAGPVTAPPRPPGTP